MTRRRVTDDEAHEAYVALKQYRIWIFSKGRHGYLSADGVRYRKFLPSYPNDHPSGLEPP